MKAFEIFQKLDREDIIISDTFLTIVRIACQLSAPPAWAVIEISRRYPERMRKEIEPTDDDVTLLRFKSCDTCSELYSKICVKPLRDRNLFRNLFVDSYEL